MSYLGYNYYLNFQRNTKKKVVAIINGKKAGKTNLTQMEGINLCSTESLLVEPGYTPVTLALRSLRSA